MPMTEEDRSHWEYCTWELNPRDVLLMHPGAIHGWAPVGPTCPERHTLVLRFVGDNCIFADGLGMWSAMKQYKGLKTGDHFSGFMPDNFLLHGPGYPKKADAGSAAKL